MFEKATEKILESLTLTVIILGVLLLLLAAGALSKFGLGIEKPGWPIPVAVIGVILVGIGIFWHERTKDDKQSKPITVQDKNRTKIEGKYKAQNDPNYVVVIGHLSESLYQTRAETRSKKNLLWEGVGFFDGESYFGIYQYVDNPESEVSGNWGVHKAKLRPGGGALNLHVMELSDKSDDIEYEYIWVKDIDGE